jgi:hypothetical protein
MSGRVVSDIQTLAFGSSLYIRYNTAAHVVNITYKLAVEKDRDPNFTAIWKLGA